MINTKFEAYKLKRELKRNGVLYEFVRKENNRFGEPDGETISICCVTGLYHEQNSNIQITTGDTTQTRTKKIPMILCVYDDFVDTFLRPGDFVIINDKKFKVTGIVNVQEWNIALDISLEVVDNGT